MEERNKERERQTRQTGTAGGARGTGGKGEEEKEQGRSVVVEKMDAMVLRQKRTTIQVPLLFFVLLSLFLLRSDVFFILSIRFIVI